MYLDAVLFDLDGTLIDSSNCILKCFNEAFRKIKMSYPGDETIKTLIGRSLDDIISILGVPGELSDEFKRTCRATTLNCNEISMFPLMREILFFLKEQGIPIGIVTSKSIMGVEHSFKVVGLKFEHFDCVITATDTNKHKPDPEPVLIALKKIGITPSNRVFFVGDSFNDIESALNAGVTPVFVDWGIDNSDSVLEKIRNKKEKLVIVKTPFELKKLFEELVFEQFEKHSFFYNS